MKIREKVIKLEKEAQAHNKPLSSKNSLNSWFLVAKKRLAGKRRNLRFSADVEKPWVKLLDTLGPAPLTGSPV